MMQEELYHSQLGLEVFFGAKLSYVDQNESQLKNLNPVRVFSGRS